MTPNDGTPDTPDTTAQQGEGAKPPSKTNPAEAKPVNPAIPKIDELIAQLAPDKSEGAQNACGLLAGAKKWLEKA